MRLLELQDNCDDMPGTLEGSHARGILTESAAALCSPWDQTTSCGSSSSSAPLLCCHGHLATYERWRDRRVDRVVIARERR